MAEESDIDDILNKLDQLLKEGTDGNDDADAQAEQSGPDAAGEEQDEPENEDIFHTEALVEEETPVEEAPVEEAPVEEAPVEEAPVEEAPVEEAPVEEAPVEEAPVEEAPVEEVATQPEAAAQPSVEVAEEVPRVVLTEDMLMENPQNPLPLAFGDDEAGHVTMVEDEAAERESGSQALPDDWVDRVSDVVLQRLAGILPRLIQEAVNEHAAGTLAEDEIRHAEKDSER